jgi:single-strand DNA-binding protein
MNYNQCTIIGRLVAEPELSHTQSGVAVCKMRVAVNRIQSAEARAQGAQAEADFFDVSAWRQSGEYAAQYLGKGRLVLVAGKMQLRDYTDKEGIKRKAFEIVADQVKGLDRAEGNGGEGDFSSQAAQPAQQRLMATREPSQQPRRRPVPKDDAAESDGDAAYDPFSDD